MKMLIPLLFVTVLLTGCVSAPRSPQMLVPVPRSGAAHASSHPSGHSIRETVDTVQFRLRVVDEAGVLQPNFGAGIALIDVDWLVLPYAPMPKGFGTFLLGKNSRRGLIAINGKPTPDSGIYHTMEVTDFLRDTDITFIIKQHKGGSSVEVRKNAVR